MNYFIQAFASNEGLLGTQNQAILRDCKTTVKLNNRLKWFNPESRYTEIKVFSFTNVYNENTYKLIRTIKKPISC